jgi:arsenate reductase (thioredoxin)
MKRVLFVCQENACRSQMAEAFARIHGRDKLTALSAGSMPSGKVNPRAIALMQGIGYDMSGHVSKSLADVSPELYDYVITMGCGDACPIVPAVRREDWAVPDPKDMDEDGFRRVRDVIETKVLDLISKFS